MFLQVIYHSLSRGKSYSQRKIMSTYRGIAFQAILMLKDLRKTTIRRWIFYQMSALTRGSRITTNQSIPTPLTVRLAFAVIPSSDYLELAWNSSWLFIRHDHRPREVISGFRLHLGEAFSEQHWREIEQHCGGQASGFIHTCLHIIGWNRLSRKLSDKKDEFVRTERNENPNHAIDREQHSQSQDEPPWESIPPILGAVADHGF